MEEQLRGETRVCRSASRAHPPRPAPGSPARRVLFSTFRGVCRPPALLPRPARGRLGSGALIAWPARRPFPSPSRAVVQEGETCRSPRPPRRSQARQTLTHSCPEGKRRCASTLSPGEAQLPGGVQERLAGGPGRSGKHGLEPRPLLCRPCPRSGSAPAWLRPGLLRAKGGVRSPDVIAGPRAGRPLPRAPGARAAARRRQRGGPGRRRPRRPAGRALAGSQARPAVSQKSPCLITHSRGLRVR